MPTYTCTARAGWFDGRQKQAIAEVITRAHAEVTGAPAYFAQVLFVDLPVGNHFIGGTPLAHDHVFVHGRIRAGRSCEVRDALLRRLTADVATAAGIDTFGVWVYLLELPATAMVEFGHVLPDAGQEEAWTAALPDRVRDQLEGIGRGVTPPRPGDED